MVSFWIHYGIISDSLWFHFGFIKDSSDSLIALRKVFMRNFKTAIFATTF